MSSRKMSNHLLGSPASSNTSDDRMEIKQRYGIGVPAQRVSGHVCGDYCTQAAMIGPALGCLECNLQAGGAWTLPYMY